MGITDSRSYKKRIASEEAATKRGMTARSLNDAFYDQIVSGSDSTQERRLGELIAVLEKEQKTAKGTRKQEIESIVSSLRFDNTEFDFELIGTSVKDEINEAFKLLGKNSVVLRRSSAHDLLEEELVPTGKSVV